MDITQMRAECEVADRLLTAFDGAVFAMYAVSSEPEYDETRFQRFMDRVSNIADEITLLTPDSIAALRAKAAVAYFFAKDDAGPINVIDVGSIDGFTVLAHAFCGDFAARLDQSKLERFGPKTEAVAHVQ